MNHELRLRKHNASDQIREALAAASPGDSVLITGGPRRVLLDGEPIIVPYDVALRQDAKLWFVLPIGGQGFRSDSSRFCFEGLRIKMLVPTRKGTVGIEYGNATRLGGHANDDNYGIQSTSRHREAGHCAINYNHIQFVPPWRERFWNWLHSLRWPITRSLVFGGRR